MARNHLLSIATIVPLLSVLILGMSALLTMNTSNFLNNLNRIKSYLSGQELDERYPELQENWKAGQDRWLLLYREEALKRWKPGKKNETGSNLKTSFMPLRLKQ